MNPIARLVVVLTRPSRLISPLRRRLWRLWYERLSRTDGDRTFTLMNYGYWDPQAPTLDLRPDEEDQRCCLQLYHRVAGQVDLEGREVLEVSCGRGGGTAWVSRALGPRRMVGLDFAEANIRCCQALHGTSGVQFQVGDAEHLPFDGDSFDGVLNVEASHCYGSRPTFFQEVARVLRPGGALCWADLVLGAPADTARLRSQVEAAGLVIRRLENIAPQVRASLARDSERRNRLIDTKARRGLVRRALRLFAGVPGSAWYGRLERGELAYLCLWAEKPLST